MPDASSYETLFRTATDGHSPWDWQASLAADTTCQDRLIRIPTGFGKTAGVILTWLHHAVARGDSSWPRRLVFTLPMRVLVEQSEREIASWLHRLGLTEKVGLHVLMGGVESGEWALSPERPAILLGTQDMLLSRALNRGYSAARGRWPVDFGLLHQDALWVLDEIQLMGVGLATSAQLAAFRAAEAGSALRPTATWWMSATLQTSWLETIDAGPLVPGLSRDMTAIGADARSGGLWENTKPVTARPDVATPTEIAALAQEHHQPGTLSLVVVNRVGTAIEVYQALDDALSTGRAKTRQRADDAPDLQLVHSRFRGADREAWPDVFLSRAAALPPAGRIIVATQVIEAGVDLSAGVMVTELAPWASLVQRFGRAARDPGQTAQVFVVRAAPEDDKAALPYSAAALGAAADAIARLSQDEDASIAGLARFEDGLVASEPETIAALYPYAPGAVLRRVDLDDLFDTSPDLSGADLDISRFIRSGEERDVSLFWRVVETGYRPLPTSAVPAPARRELCRAPIGAVRDWLKKRHAFVFDYLEGQWRRADRLRITPGMTLLVPSDQGGYHPKHGFDPSSKAAVQPVPSAESRTDAFEETAASADADALSAAGWKTIATHVGEVAAEVQAIGRALGVPTALSSALQLAARWHDLGKAHPVFQGAITQAARHAAQPDVADRQDLAKAPGEAWRRPAYPARPGFRHELASMLALFELLRRAAPEHPALLGGSAELLEVLGQTRELVGPDERIPLDHPLAQELVELDAPTFDLVAYLVLSHHGKVRTSLASTPRDQDLGEGTIHGVRQQDDLPACPLPDHEGALKATPSLTLSLDLARLGFGTRYGASWTERVQRLVAAHGPFRLAWLEALLRAADARASRLTTEDPAL